MKNAHTNAAEAAGRIDVRKAPQFFRLLLHRLRELKQQPLPTWFGQRRRRQRPNPVKVSFVGNLWKARSKKKKPGKSSLTRSASQKMRQFFTKRLNMLLKLYWQYRNFIAPRSRTFWSNDDDKSTQMLTNFRSLICFGTNWLSGTLLISCALKVQQFRLMHSNKLPL